jgi:hypothetical protein
MNISIPQLLLLTLAHSLLKTFSQVVCLSHKHVHKRGFSMVQMAHNSDISYLIGKAEQICHEFSRKVDGWKLRFRDRKFLLLHGGDDRLGQRLGIFLLDQGLDIGTINLLCAGIILLVFVQNNSVGRTIFATCESVGGLRAISSEGCAKHTVDLH